MGLGIGVFLQYSETTLIRFSHMSYYLYNYTIGLNNYTIGLNNYTIGLNNYTTGLNVFCSCRMKKTEADDIDDVVPNFTEIFMNKLIEEALQKVILSVLGVVKMSKSSICLGCCRLNF